MTTTLPCAPPTPWRTEIISFSSVSLQPDFGTIFRSYGRLECQQKRAYYLQAEVLVTLFFLEVVFTAAWNIWTIHNGKIFRHEDPTFRAWKRNFIYDITLLSHMFHCFCNGLTTYHRLAWGYFLVLFVHRCCCI